MGWMETCAVDERIRLVLAVERREEPMAALCRRFGVSRRIGYKWLARYREDGVAGLADRSRAPRHHPQEVSAALAEHCLAVRRAHPTWGPVRCGHSFGGAPRRRTGRRRARSVSCSTGKG